MRVARVTRLLLVFATAALVAESLTAAAESQPAAAPGLQRFSGCAPFLSYVKTHAKRIVGPYGLPGVGPAVPTAAADTRGKVPGLDYSTTNVQEAGVDEPDVVKTDGRRIVALAQGKLQVVSLSRAKPGLAGSLQLAQPPQELLLYGDRALVISQELAVRPLPGPARSILPRPSRTLLTEVDLGASGPRVVRTLDLDGAYVGARLVGSSVRLVVTSPPPIGLEPPKAPGPEGERAATAGNRAAIDSSRARDWLPSYVLTNRRTGATRKGLLLGCRDIGHPPRFSGLGMLAVLTFDLSKGLLPVDSDGVLSDGQTVYASTESLYVATQRWIDPVVLERTPPRSMTTALHKFDISRPLETRYRATGYVAGYVQNQFSLSEYRGVLRVLTTELPGWWGGPETPSESFVTALAERSGKLVRLGRVGGLGRGERTYGVRFIGDVGYVVTFRQVDPLYTIDLSRPSQPEVRGELKILGYSAYLHPLGGELLLGVGQDATEDGRVLGTQVSVFDVSDLRRPALLLRKTLGKGWSEVEWDHRAFLYWPPARVTVLPLHAAVVSPGPDRPFAGAVVVRVGRSAIDVAGTVSHPGSAPIRRSLVVGQTLYTLSDAGLEGAGLSTLARRDWLPFS